MFCTLTCNPGAMWLFILSYMSYFDVCIVVGTIRSCFDACIVVGTIRSEPLLSIHKKPQHAVSANPADLGVRREWLP
jgi:hypothetical protein